MDKYTYLGNLNVLKSQYDNAVTELNRAYAIANSPAKVGDVITDHYHAIRVEQISVVTGRYKAFPQCVYIGVELKKNGTPTVRQSDTTVYQENLKFINGEKIKGNE